MKVIVHSVVKKEGFTKTGSPYSGSTVKLLNPEDQKTGYVLYVDESILPYEKLVIGGAYDMYLTPDGRNVVCLDPMFDVDSLLAKRKGDSV